jgi:poly(hydroxyalkanoate) granule-associated protein
MSKKAFEFDPTQLSDQVKASAQQIWLAGLGAFAKNQEEGKKVFDKLVSDGLNLQKKTTDTLHAKVSEAQSHLSAMASNLSKDTHTHWAPLEDLFQTRVAKAMEKLHAPSAAEFQDLLNRVEDLEKKLSAFSAKSTTQTAPPKPASKRVKSASKP